MRAIAIDFETANERRTSPCALGLAWIDDGVVTRREYTLIRPPEMRFGPWNIRIHGIRPEDVRSAPELPEAVEPFMVDLVGRTILAQNAGFDIGVLCATLAHYGVPVPQLTYLCTRAMGRRAWPEDRRHGLAALAARIGLTFTHHHAGEDAYACAQVAIAAARHVGTTAIGIAAERLQVRAGSVDWPVHVPCISTSLRTGRAREIRVPAVRSGDLAGLGMPTPPHVGEFLTGSSAVIPGLAGGENPESTARTAPGTLPNLDPSVGSGFSLREPRNDGEHDPLKGLRDEGVGRFRFDSSKSRPGHLAFTMRGSRGDRYDIVGGLDRRGGYELRCSCTAGQHRRRCRHVTALLDGEVTDLVSENHYDVEKLRAVVQAVGEDAILPAAVPLVSRSAA